MVISLDDCEFTVENRTDVVTALDDVETAFSQEMIAYWISFVRTKDPNVYKLSRSPSWPGYVENQRVVLQQDPNNSTTNSGIFVESESEGELRRCAFVASKWAHMQD